MRYRVRWTQTYSVEHIVEAASAEEAKTLSDRTLPALQSDLPEMSAQILYDTLIGVEEADTPDQESAFDPSDLARAKNLACKLYPEHRELIESTRLRSKNGSL